MITCRNNTVEEKQSERGEAVLPEAVNLSVNTGKWIVPSSFRDTASSLNFPSAGRDTQGCYF